MEGMELIDIADDLLVINKTTIERLFKEKDMNPLVLYMFYYKTAKWQNHNPIKASDDYCKKCLHWGIDKLQATKKRLKEMELIEIIQRKDEQGKIEGWYIKVNYLVNETTIPETTIPSKPQLVSQETNTINNKYINTNNNINTNKKEIYKERNESFKKPTLEEVNEYCKERNNGIDAEYFIDFYESKNWMIGKSKMKDWKACVRTWEKNRKKDNKEEVLPEWFNKDLNKREEKKEDNLTDEQKDRIKRILANSRK